MTEREFIFWLRGYLGYCDTNSLNSNQTSLIRYNLSRVEHDIKIDKHLDEAISGQEKDYEEEIDLYQTYGGD